MWVRLLCGWAVVLAATVSAGQTIQLPSFSSFGVNTTVVVPDSGGAYIARDRRSYQNLNTFGGVPPNRGWSIRRRVAGVGLTARIHDPGAADAARLGGSFAAGAPATKGPANLRIGAGRAAGDAPPGSVAELQRRRAQQTAGQAVAARREAMALLEKGRRAQAAGKASVAAIYFRMAARRATGPLRDQITAEIDALAGARPATTRTGRPDH